jgi:hypothetical protein
MEVGGLNHDTINAVQLELGSDCRVEACGQVMGVSYAAKDARCQYIELDRQQSSSHLVFQIVKPVTFAGGIDWIVAAFFGAAFDLSLEGLIRVAVVYVERKSKESWKMEAFWLESTSNVSKKQQLFKSAP